MNNTIRVAKIDSAATLPFRKHPEDAGMDFFACEDITINPHTFGIVRTGITMEIPEGYVALIRLKSRSNFMLAAGVVDAGYQGEIMIKVLNPTELPLRFVIGDPVAQILIIPVQTPAIEEVDLSEIHQIPSARGATGGIVNQK